MELFWKGARDWLHCHPDEDRQKKAREELWNSYTANFDLLRNQICAVRSGMKKPKIRGLETDNYATGSDVKERLVDNLRNTEIDIVLQTSDFLFIGEAKHESTFHANSKFVLVHQLVRQYVTAKVLSNVTGCKRMLVPFVIGDCREHLLKTSQVNLMTQLKRANGEAAWMDEDNVLTWNCLENIATGQR